MGCSHIWATGGRSGDKKKKSMKEELKVGRVLTGVGKSESEESWSMVGKRISRLCQYSSHAPVRPKGTGLRKKAI